MTGKSYDLVNAADIRSRGAVILLAALVLTAAAWMRGAEYDEQYTLFLTAGVPRPEWPVTVFPAGSVAAMQAGHATLAKIAHDLRATDVHPPLYFWAVSMWRAVFGPGLFAARMLSVLCGVVSIGMVGAIARRSAIRPALAMLLTLGFYGFVYTNAIARGFAPAQMLLLCGVASLLGRRPMLAGVCLGAACCCNYLAVFVAVAAVVGSGQWRAVAAALPFLAVDGWFFAAQHAARTGQFPPFEVWPSVMRLAVYQAGAVFGGLPLYVDGVSRLAVEAGLGLLAIRLAVTIARSRPLSASPAVRMVLGAAIATPAGLLLLGAAFDNTPIELRYLSFGLPFIGLLVAWGTRPAFPALAGPTPAVLRRRNNGRSRLLPVVLTIQFASIAGLLLSPRTMQPARAAAIQAARLIGDGIVILPRGNDGVGIPGAFGMEAPPSLPIMVVGPADRITAGIAPYHRVVLALLAQDPDSIETIAALRATFAPPNWRLVAIGSNVELYERTGTRE